MNSPLGKYGQAVAAGISIAIIGSYLIALLFGGILDVTKDALDAMDKLAFAAVGAVFAAAATVNGVKAPLEAAHSRIDKIETATGIQTHGAYPNPLDPPIVSDK